MAGQHSTVFVHHNKFELGPDRFNENLEVVGKMMEVLANPNITIRQIMECAEAIKSHRPYQFVDGTGKPIEVKADEFILLGAAELLEEYAQVHGQRYAITPGER